MSCVVLLAALLGGDRGGGAAGVPSRDLVPDDSYTCGEGVAPADRWPSQLVAHLRADGIALGEPTVIAVTGWTTGDLSAALDLERHRGPFDLVTLLIGVNNQFRGLSRADYRREFAALVARAVALAGGRASHVVVPSIPDWGATPLAAGRDRAAIGRAIDAFNAITRAKSEKVGVRYVDVTAESRAATTRPDLVTADGLHPSPAMYAEWVATALPTVEAAAR